MANYAATLKQLMLLIEKSATAPIRQNASNSSREASLRQSTSGLDVRAAANSSASAASTASNQSGHDDNDCERQAESLMKRIVSLNSELQAALDAGNFVFARYRKMSPQFFFISPALHSRCARRKNTKN